MSLVEREQILDTEAFRKDDYGRVRQPDHEVGVALDDLCGATDVGVRGSGGGRVSGPEQPAATALRLERPLSGPGTLESQAWRVGARSCSVRGDSDT